MTNAKAEILAALPEGLQILAAVVECLPFGQDGVKAMRLPKGHTAEQLEAFLASLDFDYDAGYGMQELYGTVWLSDGSWLMHSEHDGSEWWEHMFAPPIPPELAGEVLP